MTTGRISSETPKMDATPAAMSTPSVSITYHSGYL